MSECSEDVWDTSSQAEEVEFRNHNWEKEISNKELEKLNQKFYKLGLRNGILDQKLNYNDLGSKQGYLEGLSYGKKLGSLAGSLCILTNLLHKTELESTYQDISNLKVDDFIDKKHFHLYPNKIDQKENEEEEVKLNLDFKDLSFKSHLKVDEIQESSTSKVEQMYKNYIEKLDQETKDL